MAKGGWQPGANKGVKRGPRQLGSTYKTTAKLLPRPSAPLVASTSHLDRPELGSEEEYGPSESDSEPEIGRNVPVVLPLRGCTVTVTGCKDRKADLLALAGQMGAVQQPSLTESTTHLIADEAGSPKYEVAVRYRMKIMSPDWLDAVSEAFQSGRRADYDAIEQEHVRKPLEGVTLTTTQFSQGEHLKQLQSLVTTYGGTFSSRLHTDTAVLLVASPSHADASPSADKINAALKQPKTSIVWEGWLLETVRCGGVRRDRMQVWAWQMGGKEPSREEVYEEDLAAAKRMKEEERASKRPAAGEKGKQRVDLNDLDGQEEEVATQRRTKVGRAAKDSVQEVDNLLLGYTTPALTVANTSNRLSPVPGVDAPTAMAVDSAVSAKAPLARPNATLPQAGPSRSVLKSIQNARGAKFEQPTPKASTGFQPRSAASASIAEPPAAAAPPSSQLAETVAQGGALESDDDSCSEPDEPIFDGLTFAVMEMGHSAQAVAAGIRKLKGSVKVDDPLAEKTADWVVVPHFNAPSQYVNSSDKRVVTVCWVEQCMYHSRLVPPSTDLFLARPLVYRTPVPGGDALDVHFSAFEDVDKLHLLRFVNALGGKASDFFERKRSHLVLGDLPNDGIKSGKAHDWGKPIWSREQLESFGREQARRRDAELRSETPVAGAAAPREKMNLVEEEGFFEAGKGILAGCTCLLSTKLGDEAKALATSRIHSLGATLSRSSSAPFTHLIHPGPSPTPSSIEGKAVRAAPGRFIVHPVWLERSEKDQERANEAEYPPGYEPALASQLEGLIESPPRDMRKTSTVPSLPSQSPSQNRDAVKAEREPPARESQSTASSSPPKAPSARNNADHSQESSNEAAGGRVLSRKATSENNWRYDPTQAPPTFDASILPSSLLNPGGTPRRTANEEQSIPQSVEHPSRAWDDLTRGDHTALMEDATPDDGSGQRRDQDEDDSQEVERAEMRSPRKALRTMALQVSTHEQERAAGGAKEKNLELSRQTANLLAQLEASGEGAKGRGKTAIRKRTSLAHAEPERYAPLLPDSLSTTYSPSPLPALPQARRLPGISRTLESSSQVPGGGAYSQYEDESQGGITFDSPSEVRQRLEILEALRGNGPQQEDSSVVVMDSPNTRLKRRRREEEESQDTQESATRRSARKGRKS